MAKGLEDTTFYRYHPLASINEVGGDLNQFGVTPQFFHKEKSDTSAKVAGSHAGDHNPRYKTERRCSRTN